MIEKIDIIENSVYCYDLKSTLIKTLSLNEFIDVNPFYIDGSKLVTFNLNTPTKRLIKFSEINLQDISAQFVEYLYIEMDLTQQAYFDSFTQQAENL